MISPQCLIVMNRRLGHIKVGFEKVKKVKERRIKIELIPTSHYFALTISARPLLSRQLTIWILRVYFIV